MTTTAAPMCMWCTRFKRDTMPPACEAFPKEIPAAIWASRFDHRKAYAGDHGKRFELVKGERLARATRAFTTEG